MESVYIDVDSRWGIIVCYNYDILDFDDMWAIMRSFGLSDKNANKSLRILSSYNTGMTISNADIRMSVVFIGDAISNDEWWSTLSHELWHVATSIIDYYDEPYDEEPAAYLYGELMRLAINEIGEPCY